jgi:hypothetical protein
VAGAHLRRAVRLSNPGIPSVPTVQVKRCGIVGNMGSSGLKQKIVETVQDLPDDATVEDAIERLYFLAKIERGLEQSEAGDTVSHEEVKKRFLG